MSDPLATTVQTLDSIALGQHALNPRSEAEIRALSGKADKDMRTVVQKMQKVQLDVQPLAGIKWLGSFCADAEVLKRMEGKNGGSVLLASSTSTLEVRHAVPRLLKTLQDMYDTIPALCPQWPVSRQGVQKAVMGKAMVGGGTQYTLGRLLEYGPKKGVAPPRPFDAGEVVAANLATGRRISTPDRAPMAITERDVKVHADSDNGFPVGGTMRDPFAQAKVLELAAQLRNTLTSKASSVKAGVEVLMRLHPEVTTCKGKTKTDVYSLAKVSARQLRFYNVVPRQLVVMMQTATQPLADSWKEGSQDNWTTGIGKGFAQGRADELVRWLDQRLETDTMAWTHTGDDTLVVRRWHEAGECWVEIFSLDCSSFDLTQHHETTRWVHQLFAQQLRNVDEVAGELWHSLARERTVTIAGSLPVRVKHWGASGMPLQSEVNDTLMECLLRRLAKKKWSGKAQLAAAVQEVGAEVGFQVRLEDHFQSMYLPTEPPVRSLLRKRPFLYLGYFLYEDVKSGMISACLDIQRFFSGAAYLSGGYVEKSQVGTKAALALAGYALSMGVPPPFFEDAHSILRRTAIAALEAVGARLTGHEVEMEVARHVFAGLPRIADVSGLVAAVGHDPRIIWHGGFVEAPEAPLGLWADEPWVKEADSPFAFLDPKLNELLPAGADKAGRVPPTPSRVLEERELKAQRRQEAEVEREGRPKRRGRGGRALEATALEDVDEDDYDESSYEASAGASDLDEELDELHAEEREFRRRERDPFYRRAEPGVVMSDLYELD